MKAYKFINKALVVAALAGGSFQGFANNTATSTIYGYKAWSNDPEYTDLGWYKISADGFRRMLWADSSDVLPAYFISGWLRDGHLCGIYGNYSQAFHIEYNAMTGEFLGLYPIDLDGPNFYRYMYTAAYNPNDDYVYGFSFNSDFSQDYFVRAPASDLNAVEIIRPMPSDYTLCTSVCVNPIDSHIYGTDFLGDFIRIDVNGNFELMTTYGLTDSDDIADWASGFTFSPLDNCYFWNRQLADFSSSWVKIDAETFEYTKVSELNFLDLFTVLDCIDTDGDPNGPARPQIISHTLNSGSSDCSLSFVLPSVDKTGAALSGSIAWTATDRTTGTQVNGQGMPGTEATAQFTGLLPGEHTVAVAASTSDASGDSSYLNAWVGADSPAMVKNLKILPNGDTFKASWDAPDAGAHAGYIDPANQRYLLYVGNDRVAMTADAEATFSLPEGFAEPSFQLVVFTYNYVDKLLSEAVISDVTDSHATLPLPYSVTPTDDEFAQMTIINVDNDNSTWKKGTDLLRQTAFQCTSDETNQADDWLIFPALNFNNPQFPYEFSMRVASGSNSKTGEYVEVRIGKEADPAKMTTAIIERTNVLGTNYKELKTQFSLPEAGPAFIGIHCVSEPKMSGLYVRDINVKSTDGSGIALNKAVDTLSVKAVDGGIMVSAANEGSNVAVFCLDGRRTATARTSAADTFIPLEAGFYVVRCGREIRKIQVK